MERFGDWVRERRQALGLTQGELGQRLGKRNVYVSNIENRRPEGRDVLPSKELLPSLADALQVPLDEVVRRYGAAKAGVPVDAVPKPEPKSDRELAREILKDAVFKYADNQHTPLVDEDVEQVEALIVDYLRRKRKG